MAGGLIGTGIEMKGVAQRGLQQAAVLQGQRESEYKADKANVKGQQMQLAGMGASLGAAAGGAALGASMGAWGGPVGMAAGALLGYAIGEL